MLNRLKEFRKQKMLSQVEVSDSVGISRSNYCNIELGRSNPTLPLLIKILQFLNVSFEEVYMSETVDDSFVLTEYMKNQYRYDVNDCVENFVNN